MADKETATKVEEHNAPVAESDELLSLESLDSMIAQADPEFAKSLEEIGPDEVQNLDLDSDSLEVDYTLEAEQKRWQDAVGWRKKWLVVLPFLPRISYRLKMKRVIFRLTTRRWKEQAIYRLKNFGPLLVAWLKKQVADLRGFSKESLTQFGQFSLVKKLLFVGLILIAGGASALLYRIATTGVLPHDEDLFIGSLADWSTQPFQYDPTSQQESFFDSTRTSQNILLLKKLMVNLRRSSESGSNPMGAFEFLLEGAAAEVLVEIKDREPEVEDLFLRTIEEMTFDQVSSGEGKKLLCDRLRKEINAILTQGFVRKVYIKTAIVKP